MLDNARRSYRKHRLRRIADTTAWQKANPDRRREGARARREANPDQARAWSRKASAKLKYGLTADELAALEATADGRCAICRQPEVQRRRDGGTKALAIDHNHETGEVRGLLCHGCNIVLGWLERIERNAKWREAAFAYLRSTLERQLGVAS